MNIINSITILLTIIIVLTMFLVTYNKDIVIIFIVITIITECHKDELFWITISCKQYRIIEV